MERFYILRVFLVESWYNIFVAIACTYFKTLNSLRDVLCIEIYHTSDIEWTNFEIMIGTISRMKHINRKILYSPFLLGKDIVNYFYYNML